MSLQAVPGVAGDAVVPPDAELGDPAVLGLELEVGDLLVRVFLLVPADADVFDRLLVEIFEQLRAEGVGDLVLHVEVTRALGEGVDGVVFANVGFRHFSLFFACGEHAEFGHVVAEAVGGLRIFGHGDHCQDVEDRLANRFLLANGWSWKRGKTYCVDAED